MSEKISVEAMDPSKKNSPVAGPIEEESTVMLDKASKVCYWNDQEFKEGQVVESDGAEYECNFGQWIKQD
ncbi:MAG: hypothetical protein GTO67_05460 [Gammaproteobacteria bacterium]|nr:hypothetical protein [Gammaproteobacteria bacterium]NIM73957.1 hypothetical protein [Gammaproteobacteria bacterium]NIN38145.1 hypothetical protein [Gammaproteobacteria bacterium]NIO25738.1 hypothetical protein [Gammaproteobacteria bacterium]NIO66372.1 hypothetical protein [Gammaproteobacteria bacterium]